MPTITQAIDDVAPVTGVLAFGGYTNDTAPLVRVALSAESVAGDSIGLNDGGTPTGASAVLTAADVAAGFVDVQLSGLGPDWHQLAAVSAAADGTVKAVSQIWALGIATATPPAPVITAVVDHLGTHTGTLADGAQTDDPAPTFQLFEQGLPPIPTSSPGHAPFGGPALQGGQIALFDGTTLVATGQLSFGGEVTLAPGALSPGDHVLTAVVTDRAGNVSPASAPFHLIVGPDGGVAPGSNQPTAGDDVLQAGPDFNDVDGGLGSDTITGWAGGDRLRGGPGNDVINGGSGFDIENGNEGADTVHGGQGGDWVAGGRDNDLLFGDGGDDVVVGNLGADTLDGGDGSDVLRGGQGNDVLVGGAGDDYLSGDRGDDTLTGGAGADSFHTFAGAGSDVVTDFNRAEGDRVVIDGGGHFAATQDGADVHITFQNGSEMLLKTVQLASLTPGWIVAA